MAAVVFTRGGITHRRIQLMKRSIYSIRAVGRDRATGVWRQIEFFGRFEVRSNRTSIDSARFLVSMGPRLANRL